MRMNLKDTAADIAAYLCDSIARNLVGQNTGSLRVCY
jgi:hypothetical protein